MRRSLTAPSRFHLRAGLLIPSLVLAAPPLQPVDPGPSEAIDAITDLLLEANLQGRFIFDVDFDQEEMAWFATADGLHAYDGYRWRRYTTADGLPSDFVRCVLSASNGSLWIGTDRGLAIRDGQIFRTLQTGEGGPAGPNIRSIYEDRDGAIWFCSDQWIRSAAPGGLACFREGDWITYRQQDGLPSDYVSDCFRDSRGRLFVLTAEGLGVQEDGQWRRPLEEQAMAGARDYFWSAAEASDGTIVAATEHAFYLLRDEAWQRIPRDRPRSHLPKFDMIGEGEILTVGDRWTKQFLRWDGSGFQPVSPSFDAAGSAEHVVQAPDGSLWAVGYNLLVRWDRNGGEWHRWPRLPPPLTVDDEGRVWFTDGQRVLALTKEGWFQLPDAHPSLAFGPEGDLWSWSREEVIFHEQVTPRRYPVSALDLMRVQFCTFDTADGSLIVMGEDVAGAAAIVRRTGDEWQRVGLENIKGGRIVSFGKMPQGGLGLLVRSEGLWEVLLVQMTGETRRRIQIPAIRTYDNAHMHIDGRGGIWLYGEFGLMYEPSSGSAWEQIEGMPGHNVTGAMSFGDAVWFATNGISGGGPGAARFRNGEWSFISLESDFLAGRTTSGVVLGARGHLIRQDASGNLTRLQLPTNVYARVALGDENDRLWLDADGTVVTFVSDGIAPETLVISPVREVLQGRSIPFTFAGVERYKPHAPERLDYSWRIDGGAWSDFAPLPYQGLDVELANGRHLLEVRARDQGLDVDATPARLAFAVVPPPMQVRWWFWPLAVAMLIMVSVLAVVALASRNRIRTYATNLQNLVDARTADLGQSERRFRLLVERSPYGICELDEHGRIISINAAGAQLLSDRPPDQLAGQTFASIAGRGTLAVSALTDHLHEGRAATVEMEVAGRECVARLSPIHQRNGDTDRFMLLLVDVTHQRTAERRQRMLMRELDHRVKNNLTSILSLLDQSLASASSLESFTASFTGRIRALARTHETLASAKWSGAQIGELISMIVEPYAVEQQIVMEGESVLLPARVSSPLAMTLHELTTNAVKYGALSTRQGRVHVRWQIVGDPVNSRRLWLEWIEEEGPPVAPTPAAGVGLTLIEGFIRYELKGEVTFEHRPGGLHGRLSIPLPTDDQPEGAADPQEKP